MQRARTVRNDALRRLRVDDVREVRVQHAPRLIVFAVHLVEVRLEVVDDGLILVRAIAIRWNAACAE